MSFRNIEGQDEAVDFLQTTARNNRISHAYIFAGSRGGGRSLIAREFAKAVNCAEPESAPCDSCVSCRKIGQDIHPDVKWLRPDEKSSQIKIEQVRELQSRIALKPYEARYKVCIIVDAETMTIEAANSFLKTLEEPPGDSLFILITEKPKDLLPTIASRCQTLRLRAVSTDSPSPALVDVLAEFSDDACIEDYTARDRGGLSDKLKILASWYRDLLIFNSTGNRDLLIHRDRLDDVRKNAAKYNTEDLMRMLESVLNAKVKIDNNVNPKLALSAMLKELSINV